ncbi:MAG: HupE/UreJ family protein [Gemmatimonadaceae bacterium]
MPPSSTVLVTAPRVRSSWRRLTVVALGAIIATAVTPRTSESHEIPSSVTVLAFIKPEGRQLHMVIRVPLGAMRDMEPPLRPLGLLDVSRAEPVLRDAAQLWLADYIQFFENGVRLPTPRVIAVRASLPSEKVFTSYESALTHIMGPPLDPATEIAWQQAMFDVVLEYPITSDRDEFSIVPTLAHLGVRTTTVLHFLPPGGGDRAYEYTGNPGRVRLDPRWYHAAWQFVGLGFQHILDGIDHLLFVLCLVIPFRRVRPLIAIVTSFTVAHSITLIGSASGFAPDGLWFPPLIEVLIALSIVYMACENVVGARLDRRWLVAFGFGLVHGFGFSFALRQSLQFAGTHLATSLLAFNVGVELGQIAVLLVAVPALAFVFRRLVSERMGTILLSAMVGHTAWHWMVDRFQVLRGYEFPTPTFDAPFFVSLLRWLLAAVVLTGVAWALSRLFAKTWNSQQTPA